MKTVVRCPISGSNRNLGPGCCAVLATRSPESWPTRREVERVAHELLHDQIIPKTDVPEPEPFDYWSSRT